MILQVKMSCTVLFTSFCEHFGEIVHYIIYILYAVIIYLSSF